MVSTVLWILLLLALVCVPAAAGALRRGAARPDWLAVGGAVVVGVVFGVLAVTTYETGVSTEDTIKGVALAFALGAVPAYALFALGRALGDAAGGARNRVPRAHRSGRASSTSSAGSS